MWWRAKTETIPLTANAAVRAWSFRAATQQTPLILWNDLIAAQLFAAAINISRANDGVVAGASCGDLGAYAALAAQAIAAGATTCAALTAHSARGQICGSFAGEEAERFSTPIR
jgi:hypothetical protein